MKRPARQRQKLTGRSFGFAAPPSPGLALDIHGQRYDLVDVEPYRNRAGEESALSVWLAACRKCGREFTSRTARRKFPETRNCPDCRPISGARP